MTTVARRTPQKRLEYRGQGCTGEWNRWGSRPRLAHYANTRGLPIFHSTPQFNEAVSGESFDMLNTHTPLQCAELVHAAIMLDRKYQREAKDDRRTRKAG